MTEVVNVNLTAAPAPVKSEVAPVPNKRLENSKAAMALKAAKKLRSKSADAQPNKHTIRRDRGKHAQISDIMTVEDRRALSLNRYEEAMTLADLQDQIKRQPDQYLKDFKTHFNIFTEKLKVFKLNPAKHETDFIDYLKFMAHCSEVYKKQIANFLSNEMLNLLQQYYSILNPEVRMALVTCLKVMRGKNTVQAAVVLPVFFKLFRCKDKELRTFLHGSIVKDIKNLNKKAKNNNLNKKLQNFILGLLTDPNEDAAKRSLNVMIELYKRCVWNDEKTVNAIWTGGVMNSNPKIVASACKFFLVLDYEHKSESSDTTEDDAADLLKHHKGSKLTKAKKAYLERAIKSQKRKERRKNSSFMRTDFLPIDTLYDPQNFADTLFSKLKKSNDKYEVKLLMLRLLSRLIGRHNLIILQFYPYILRYLNSHAKDKVGEIFAMIIEACHELVPPEEIKPVTEKIINNYVTEYCDNAHITIGINAIREILSRMPLALDAAQIEYLVQFNHFKKNASVRMAGKSLVNFFRDVCPQLLPKKYIGRFTKIDESNKLENMVYGERRMVRGIDGVELLKEGMDVAAQRILTDEDYKKIRIQKLKQAAKGVKGVNFKTSDDEDEDNISSLSDEADFGDEDGEEDIEEGEDEMEEGQQGTSKTQAEAQRKLAIERANKQYNEMHEGSDGSIIGFSEAGEDEIEEGEFEMEEGESDLSEEDQGQRQESSEEEIPKLIPIVEKAKGKRKTKAQAKADVESSSDVSESEVSSLDSDMDTEELEALEAEQQRQQQSNEHGFVYAADLNTYRLSKQERKEKLEKEDPEKKKFLSSAAKRRKDKGGGSTNTEKLKNKPMQMLLPKKAEMRHEKRDGKMYVKRRSQMKQLGHFKKNQNQRLDSKKKRRII